MAIAMTVGATKIQILQESALTAITGKTPAEAPQEGKEGTQRHVIERSFGNFRRTLELPETVERERITGTLKDGVLTLTLPRREEKKPQQFKVEIG